MIGKWFAEAESALGGRHRSHVRQSQPGKPASEQGATLTINFHLENCLHPRTLKAEVKASDSGKETDEW